MSVAEVNFSFHGLHCLRDFGCIFIELGNSRVVSPGTNRNAYQIAGVSGTILLDNKVTHQVYNISGTLVPMKTPHSMAAAQELARRIGAWLLSGRGVLSWDYEPFQYHQAEVLAATEWETKTWMDGGLSFTFQVQPYTFDLSPAISRATIGPGTGEVAVSLSTVVPCPVSLDMKNTGEAPITSIRISSRSGHVVELAKGMALAVGSTLRLIMEPPIGAVIEDSAENQANALRYALRFDPLTVSGPEALTIVTDGRVEVTATARGCAL